jgi:hypothetical protein
MATARDRAPLFRRRLLPLTLFIAAAAALLAFAGTAAAAETKIAEGTSPVNPALPGELDVLAGTASYEPSTGSVSVTITTREAPETTPEAERPFVQYVGGLITAANPACTEASTEAEAASGGGYPLFGILAFNEPSSPGEPTAEWIYQAHATTQKESEEGIGSEFGAATKSVSGTVTTLAATSTNLLNAGYNCVEIGAVSFEGEEPETDIIFVPLTVKAETPPAQTVTSPAAHSTPAPAAASPGVLSIAKAKKPLKLKRGKWATVKVNVTNTGGSSTSPGSLQLKATKGVIVKGGKQKLPILAPGGLWTVSYKVKLTAKAKKSSTLSLVGAAGSLTAKASLVVKALGH